MEKKSLFVILICFIVTLSCKEKPIEEPKNLIEKDKMVDVMYDLVLLEALKSQSPNRLDSFERNTNQYIYKKHRIDSISFAQSNIYYASDFVQHKEMCQEIKNRLAKAKKDLQKSNPK